MREAAAQLMTRKRLGRDVFARGMPEPLRITRKSTYRADLYDLFKAYAQQRQRTAMSELASAAAHGVVAERGAKSSSSVCSACRAIGRRSISCSAEFLFGPELRRTAFASGFTATLEMTREGALEIRQAKFFAPLLVRRRGPRPLQGADDNKRGQ